MTNTKLLLIGLIGGLFFLTAGSAHAMSLSKKLLDHNTVILSGTCSKDVQIYLYDKSGTIVYNAGASCKNGTFSFVDQIDKWNLPDTTYTVVTFETGDAPDRSHGTEFILDRKEAINAAQNAPTVSLSSGSNSADIQETPLDGSTTGQATLSGDLRVKGNGLIEGILSVIDTLLTKNVVVSGIAQFFGDVFFKGNVFFTTTPTFSSDTAGFAVIKSGATKVSVTFDKPYGATPIVNATLKADGDANGILSAGYTYIISDQTTTGFSIMLNKPASEDLTFSWTSLSVSNAKTSESQ